MPTTESSFRRSSLFALFRPFTRGTTFRSRLGSAFLFSFHSLLLTTHQTMLISEGFQQPPLQIPPGYTTDPVFQCLLERILPPQIFQRVDQELKQFQVRLAGREFHMASNHAL